MSRHSFLGFMAVAVLSAAPAAAATFSGTFNGIVTSGQASTFDSVTFEQNDYDLAGDAIIISFTASVERNFTSPDGDFYPEFFDNTVSVHIPALDATPALAFVGSRQTNDINRFGTASYSGGSHRGSFYASGSTIFESYEPDFEQTVAFSFTNAFPITGPLSGSGTAISSFYNGRDYEADYTLSFVLTSGSVTGIPEPGAWVLLIAGFGAIGGMLRRRCRRAVIPC